LRAVVRTMICDFNRHIGERTYDKRPERLSVPMDRTTLAWRLRLA
jgi:hypothetical protein